LNVLLGLSPKHHRKLIGGLVGPKESNSSESGGSGSEETTELTNDIFEGVVSVGELVLSETDLENCVLLEGCFLVLSTFSSISSIGTLMI